jgi:hypothetical protein
MMRISFGGTNTFLGDVLATVYCLENLGRQTGWRSEVYGGKYRQSVLDLFDLCYIDLVSKEAGTQRIVNYLHPFPKSPDDCHHWIVLLQKRLETNYRGYDPSLAEPLKCCFSCERKEADRVLVQFDGETARRKGRSMRPGEMRAAMRLWAESDNVVAIGGPGTRLYLGGEFTYRLGDIRSLVMQMMECKHFLGTDSGMSHLAGVLGIRSKVVVLHGYDCISRFYETMYLHTTCYARSDIHRNILL